MQNYDQEKEDQRQNKAQTAATKRNIEFIEDEDDQEMAGDSKKIKYSDD